MALSTVSTVSNMSKDLPPAYHQLFGPLPPPYSSLQNPNVDSKSSSTAPSAPSFSNFDSSSMRSDRSSTTPIRQPLTFGNGSNGNRFSRPDSTRVQMPGAGGSNDNDRSNNNSGSFPSRNGDAGSTTRLADSDSSANQLTFDSRFGTSNSTGDGRCLECFRSLWRAFVLLIFFSFIIYILLRVFASRDDKRYDGDSLNTFGSNGFILNTNFDFPKGFSDENRRYFPWLGNSDDKIGKSDNSFNKFYWSHNN